MATHKTEGPSTHLGIQIDSVALELSLDQLKLARIIGIVLSWRSRRPANKRDLLLLIGHVSHATIVVQNGCTFLQWMIDLAKQAGQPHHHVRLSQEFQSDLQWWALFLPRWKGKSMLRPLGLGLLPMLRPPAPQHIIMADASGTRGCGTSG